MIKELLEAKKGTIARDTIIAQDINELNLLALAHHAVVVEEVQECSGKVHYKIHHYRTCAGCKQMRRPIAC